jgi:hypothetical protein
VTPKDDARAEPSRGLDHVETATDDRERFWLNDEVEALVKSAVGGRESWQPGKINKLRGGGAFVKLAGGGECFVDWQKLRPAPLPIPKPEQWRNTESATTEELLHPNCALGDWARSSIVALATLKLAPNLNALLTELVLHAEPRTERLTATQLEISSWTTFSERTVRDLLQEEEERGFITRRRAHDRSGARAADEIQLHLAQGAAGATGLAESDEGACAPQCAAPQPVLPATAHSEKEEERESMELYGDECQFSSRDKDRLFSCSTCGEEVKPLSAAVLFLIVDTMASQVDAIFVVHKACVGDWASGLPPVASRRGYHELELWPMAAKLSGYQRLARISDRYDVTGPQLRFLAVLFEGAHSQASQTEVALAEEWFASGAEKLWFR